jgi:hypothetical protein
MDAARAFGIAFQVDRQTVQCLKENGMGIELRSGQNHHMLPVRSVFLSSSDGVIEFQYVNPDYRIRVSPSVLLTSIDAMLES